MTRHHLRGDRVQRNHRGEDLEPESLVENFPFCRFIAGVRILKRTRQEKKQTLYQYNHGLSDCQCSTFQIVPDTRGKNAT